MANQPKPKVRLTVVRPSRLNLIGRIRGDLTVAVEVYDGRRRRYVPIQPEEIQVVE